MKNFIAATFDNLSAADEVIDTLTEKGIAMSQISVLTKEDIVRNNISLTDNDKGTGVTKAATTGGVIGGALGLLAGIGAIAIPGLGPLLIAGPIATAFGLGAAASGAASGAVTGILAGGLVGVLKEYGLDEAKAKAIEEKVKTGHILLFVDVLNSEEEEMIQNVLAKTSARDVTGLTYKK